MTIQKQKHSDLYKSFILNSGDAMYLSNLNGELIEVNKQTCINLGYTREELLNLSISDIDTNHNSDELVQEYFTILKREKYNKLTSRHKRKDGTTFPVEISVSLLNENGNKFIIGIARDITDHLQDKKDLFSYINTLDKIHLILENSENIDSMISDVLNLVQKVFSVDRAFLISTDYSTDNYQIQPIELVRDPFQAIFNKKDSTQNYSRKIIQEIKKENLAIYLESNSKPEKFENDSSIQSEMIVPITKIGETPHLLGIHQCSSNRIWTNLEQKLFLDISRRLTDAITRIINKHILQQSEEKYKTLYDNAPFGYHSLDTNGNLIDVNQTWLNLLGYTKEEIIGKNYADILHPNYKQNFINNFPVLKKRGYVHDVHFKLKSKNGKYRHISLEGCTGCHPDGSFKQTFCVIQDISAKIKAEEELKESEAKFRNFVEQAPIPLSHIDNITGEIKYVNNRFIDLFGYTHDEVSTIIKWSKLAYPDPKYRKWAIDSWRKSIKLAKKDKADIIPKVYNITCKDGNIKQVLISGISLGDDFLSMLVDITAQKKIEAELIIAKEKAEESEQLKTAFLANMSHEIRTPMNGILGFADLLQTPKLSGEKRKKFIKIIMQSGNRMLTTINDIIEVSKIETNQIILNPSEINLNEITKHYHAFFLPETQKKHIDFHLQNGILTSEYKIITDESMLNSILANLIKNAIKYTDKGSINFGYELKDNFIQFYIKDTGIGIPQNKQKIIFDRFRQVDIDNPKAIEGSGLGLSIAKAYIELLGGKIWVESEKDVGSQFYFTIPLKN